MHRLALYEDSLAGQFSPLSLLRPVFELRCGHFSVRERIRRLFPKADWGVLIRPELTETYVEERPDARVNDELWLHSGSTLFINGRWLSEPDALAGVQDDAVGIVGNEIAWLLVQTDEAMLIDPARPEEGLSRIAATRRPRPAGGVLVRYPWDLVHSNAEQINLDFASRRRPAAYPELGPQVAIQGDPQNVYIDPTAVLDPFVVVDARRGPVWIDRDVRVLPFTRIEGPSFIGAGTQLFRAHVREGTSIGPTCRVGGEIEESLLHGYVNKYHDGFLGHSYVCPWVNLGALTTNSDLKNDYSHVRVPLQGASLDTASTKVGCFIGDHSKAALCSLFNTGSSIGVMTMLLPGGELLPKHIPSFSRIWHGQLEELPDGLESSLAIARTAMGRRDVTLTPAMERLLRNVYRQTSEERTRALQRAATAAQAVTLR